MGKLDYFKIQCLTLSQVLGILRFLCMCSIILFECITVFPITEFCKGKSFKEWDVCCTVVLGDEKEMAAMNCVKSLKATVSGCVFNL